MGLLPEGCVIADRYRVADPVGRGGMAYVYRAEHLGLGTHVALKVLAPREQGGGAAGLRETRFLREARNTAGLDHPGCVRVLDYGIADDGARYLAMELIDGPTLRREMEDQRTMSVDYVLWIARELLDALAHAHGRGVLHRDVKPENVMFHTDGGGRRVVLIDFGLSRFEDDAVITAQGACVGSPSYIAPERLRGEPYDGRADVYAVGVVLFEMLAGCRPFWGEGPLETARAHLEDPPFPLEVLREDLPEDVAALIHRALSKDPADRFESAVAMLAAVERARRAFDHARRPAAPAPVRAATPPPTPTSEPSASTTCLALDRARPGLLRRAWARVRYGRWRWRARGPEPSFA